MTSIRNAIIIVIDGGDKAEAIGRIRMRELDQGIPVIEVYSDMIIFWNPDVHPYQGHEWHRPLPHGDETAPFFLHLEELYHYFEGK